jgi:hypothetical protein
MAGRKPAMLPYQVAESGEKAPLKREKPRCRGLSGRGEKGGIPYSP